MSRVLESEADLDAGIAALALAEPRFAAAHARTGRPPLRRRPPGFATLLWIIAGQQVSTASAAAICARLEAAGLTGAEAVAAGGEAALRAAGLSRPKVRYALALATSGFDFDALAALPDAQARERLIALPGIGPWSAEVYLMTALGRADVLAPGDLALQEAARRLFDLPARPDAAALARMAEAWRPWRGVAARLLWAYYRVETRREGIG